MVSQCKRLYRDGIFDMFKNHVLGTAIGVIFNRIMTRLANQDTIHAIKEGKIKESEFVAKTKSDMIAQLNQKIDAIKKDTRNPFKKDDINDVKKAISEIQKCRTFDEISNVMPDDNRIRMISDAFRYSMEYRKRLKGKFKKEDSAIIRHRYAYKKWRDDALQDVMQEKTKIITMLTNLKNSLVNFFNIPIVKKVMRILGIIIKILVASIAISTLYAKFKHSFDDSKTKRTFSEFLETDAIPKPIRLLAKAGFSACVSFARLLGRFVKLEAVEKKVEEAGKPDSTSSSKLIGKISSVKKSKLIPTNGGMISVKKEKVKEIIKPKKIANAVNGIFKTKTGSSGFSMLAADIPFSKKQMNSKIQYNIIKTDCRKFRVDGIHKVNDDVLQNLKDLVGRAKSGLNKFASTFPSVAKGLRIVLKLSAYIDMAVGGVTTTTMLATSLNSLQSISKEAEKEGAGFVFKMYIYPIIILLTGIVKLNAAKALTPTTND